MKKYEVVGERMTLKAATADAAKAEAHDVHGWHVVELAKAKAQDVLGGPSEASRVAWCVRGPKRAVILRLPVASPELPPQFAIEPFRLVDAE